MQKTGKLPEQRKPKVEQPEPMMAWLCDDGLSPFVVIGTRDQAREKASRMHTERNYKGYVDILGPYEFTIAIRDKNI